MFLLMFLIHEIPFLSKSDYLHNFSFSIYVCLRYSIFLCVTFSSDLRGHLEIPVRRKRKGK